MLWLTGGGLVVCVLMVLGLLALVVWNGIATFWPVPVRSVRTQTGNVLMGEETRRESFRLSADRAVALPPETLRIVEPQMAAEFRAALGEMEDEGQGEVAERIRQAVSPGDAGWLARLRDTAFMADDNGDLTTARKARVLFGNLAMSAERGLLRTGNYELTGEHFHWVSDFEAAEVSAPEWAIVVERLTWGRFYGFPASITVGGQVKADAAEMQGAEASAERARLWAVFREAHAEARARWRERRRLEKHATGDVNRRLNDARLSLRAVELREGLDSSAYEEARQEFQQVESELDAEFAAIREQITELNARNTEDRILLTTADGQSKEMELAEIVRAYPANRLSLWEKAGVYLSRWKEFLTEEPREANAEGGVFPAIFGTLVMTVLMSVAVAPFGVLAALYLREYAKAGPVVSAVRIAINNLAGVPSIVFGVFGLGFFCYIVGGTIDEVFFQANLPSPTFGTGGILWASLTLALLTAPVVIVATEEALAAVPASMREGSYACGGSKWQTIRRIVLPRAMPGIMTGMILAMARGAGEVAPLMLTGAVKLAPELPVDGVAPYIHPQRSFMHLGFHIFDLGFQSPNAEAAKPMVFTTTLLLIAMIALLNLTAIWLRKRLRRKFVANQF